MTLLMSVRHNSISSEALVSSMCDSQPCSSMVDRSAGAGGWTGGGGGVSFGSDSLWTILRLFLDFLSSFFVTTIIAITE